MDDLRPSRMYQQWAKAPGRCPFCNKYSLIWPDYVNGVKVPFRWTPPKDPSTMTECPKCSRRWFVWQQDVQAELIEQGSETQIVAEQEFVLDNRRGVSPMVRTRTVTQEWAQTVTIGSEETQSVETGFQIGKKDVANFTSLASNAIKTNYHVNQEMRRTYSEELPFEVPPGVERTVTLRFRRVWRFGVVRLKDEEGEAQEIPFRVSTDLDMDMAYDDVS